MSDDTITIIQLDEHTELRTQEPNARDNGVFVDGKRLEPGGRWLVHTPGSKRGTPRELFGWSDEPIDRARVLALPVATKPRRTLGGWRRVSPALLLGLTSPA